LRWPKGSAGRRGGRACPLAWRPARAPLPPSQTCTQQGRQQQYRCAVAAAASLASALLGAAWPWCWRCRCVYRRSHGSAYALT
jgi:hypothetical protein